MKGTRPKMSPLVRELHPTRLCERGQCLRRPGELGDHVGENNLIRRLDLILRVELALLDSESRASDKIMGKRSKSVGSKSGTRTVCGREKALEQKPMTNKQALTRGDGYGAQKRPNPQNIWPRARQENKNEPTNSVAAGHEHQAIVHHLSPCLLDAFAAAAAAAAAPPLCPPRGPSSRAGDGKDGNLESVIARKAGA
ncbi:hypothetical protein AXG93_4280s1240 [Marchantia polymorpha subsp. ruderalis]|uniref:Uncharacterized protein n=1 Tax=Marchantia polymorpha subsp. ruderalis TaxID=1480154 RepID=A0A176WMH1_MARPO|nr:hypothetical protein AXG93_4280s1240 [Marchantia polymorpha subsp. ruderalis]